MTGLNAASFKCATVKVPLDYANPQGESISLALKKREADGTKKGTLFINPGGPGGSGVDLVNSVSRMFSSDLLRSYDVVGFDPRGVSPVNRRRLPNRQRN